MQPQTASTSGSRFSATDLVDRAIQRRAIEAVIWGMPAVNGDLMFQAFRNIGGDFNQVCYWSGLLDWKNQTLTPNPGVIYLMPFFNTKAVGPMVLEIPPSGDEGSMTGNICDFWQCALEDVGPAGVDAGKGGKCLILPPGYKDKAPDGYIPLTSQIFEGYALLRCVLKSGSEEDIAKAVAYGKKIKIYPLSQAANPPETTFIDALGKLFDATITYDLRFFESLNRIVQIEPWLERDRAYIDSLEYIGIKKGQPFAPDDKKKALLLDGIVEAQAWLDTTFETVFPPFYPNRQWFFPAVMGVSKGNSSFYTADPNDYPVGARGVSYSMGYVGIKRGGGGQYYLYSIHDKDGKALDSNATYRLAVPPNVPITQFWSVTLYDRTTHALIREAKNCSVSSQSPDLKTNDDGSVDLHFGKAAPGGKQSNWIDTGTSENFEVLFRLYGPTKALFEKTWNLPDVEKTS
jgi:Uncharacterized conserved protein